MINQGWSCPHCGLAHSPDTHTCPVETRVYPYIPEPSLDVCAACAQAMAEGRTVVCGCVLPSRSVRF